MPLRARDSSPYGSTPPTFDLSRVLPLKYIIIWSGFTTWLLQDEEFMNSLEDLGVICIQDNDSTTVNCDVVPWFAAPGHEDEASEVRDYLDAHRLDGVVVLRRLDPSDRQVRNIVHNIGMYPGDIIDIKRDGDYVVVTLGSSASL